MGNRLNLFVFLMLSWASAETAKAQATHVTPVSDGTPQTDAEIFQAQWNAQFSNLNMTYANQIAAQKAAIDRANALRSQCKANKDVEAINTKQQKSAATIGALSGAINAAPATIGDGLNYAQAKLGKAQGELTTRFQGVKDDYAREQKTYGLKWNGSLEQRVGIIGDDYFEEQCQKGTPNKPLPPKNADQQLAYDNAINNWNANVIKCQERKARDAKARADEYNQTISEVRTQQAQLAAAGGHLAGSVTTLAAQGLMGVLTSSLTAGPAAEAQGKISDIREKACDQEADFAVADANRKLQAIQNEQAQRLLDMNVQKAASELARKQAAEQRNPVAVIAPMDAKKKTPFPFGDQKPTASPNLGASSGGGSGGGAGGASANWGFGDKGGDGEEPGGSSLPESPGAMAFNGEGGSGGGAAASSNEAGGFGSFGADAKGPEPASVEGEGVAPDGLGGDGGLHSLLNRMRNIHAKYAATLLQSQDLSQVATGIKNSGEL